jgi:hypothetical protein
MFHSLSQLFKALYSDKVLTDVYEQRKALLPAEENRSFAAVLTVGLLFMTAIAFVISITWLKGSTVNFVEARRSIRFIETAKQEWSTSPSLSCRDYVTCSRIPLSDADWQRVSLAAIPDLLLDRGVQSRRLRTSLDTLSWSNLAETNDPLILSLPSLQFHSAELAINNQPRGRFVNGQRLSAHLSPEDLEAPELFVELVLTGDSYLHELNLPPNAQLDRLASSLAVMRFSDSQEYDSIVASERLSRGDILGRMTRIVMAIFVLALFLIIDGSAETLGLGLFLGFEALAMISANGWLPGIPEEFMRNFCFQMGDIFRLYFFLQLARMIDKNIYPWLFVGGLLSCAYGLLFHFKVEQQIYWIQYIPNARDLIVGSLGCLFCLRAAWFLRAQHLPWRIAALLLATIGSFEQTIEPLGVAFPVLKQVGHFTAFQDLMQPISAWLLALSAFINISTLENRVKQLGEVAADVKQMEQEIELAQSVQDAFMRVPKLPDGLKIACFNQAIRFVSGDTYFVHWDEKRSRLSFLITDVTGHGVQAALKASGVSVLANAVWRDEVEGQDGNLNRYARRVQDLYERMSPIADVVAIGGAEFDCNKSELTLYRENFPFPILMTPRTGVENEEARWDDHWIVQLLPLPNATETSIVIPENSFVVFTSDGFMESSKSSHEFVKHLRKHLAKADLQLSADSLRDQILECQAFLNRHDDRTLTVFHYERKVAVRPLRIAA